MAATTRITVTLPTEQVAEIKKGQTTSPATVAEAVARQIRHQLLGDDLRRHQKERSAFTEEELAEARARILGDAASLGHSTDAT